MRRVKRAAWVVLIAMGSAHAAPAVPAVPAFANLTKLELQQKQGFSTIKCNGVSYEMQFDLAAGTWSSGMCVVEAGKRADTQPLTRKHGKLSAADRKKLEAAYQTLTAKTGSCGHDGGDLTLTVIDKSGAKSAFVDENWGCRKPEPVMLAGLQDVAKVAGPIALY